MNETIYQPDDMPLDIHEEPIHEWFELSYAQYLTIPRSVLQSMPVEWQRGFIEYLEELDEAINWRPKEGRYYVTLIKIEQTWSEDAVLHVRSRGIDDPLKDYDRGRRRIPFRCEEQP